MRCADVVDNSDNSPDSAPIGAIVAIGNGMERDKNTVEDGFHAVFPSLDANDNSANSANRSDWDVETFRLIEWFKTTAPPSEPFELCRGVTVLDPTRWWRSIAGDVEAGPNGPRARYGAVQGDLGKLSELFGPM
jgi:hypothetical protein